MGGSRRNKVGKGQCLGRRRRYSERRGRRREGVEDRPERVQFHLSRRILLAVTVVSEFVGTLSDAIQLLHSTLPKVKYQTLVGDMCNVLKKPRLT